MFMDNFVSREQTFLIDTVSFLSLIFIVILCTIQEGMVLVLHVDGDIPEKPNTVPYCGNWPQPRADDGEGNLFIHINVPNL